MTAPISVILIVRNEERNLPYALRSVASWAEEILVVDMHSEDRTREIAREAGARVLLHEKVGYVEPARVWSIAQARNEWVLLLDADEMVTAPLARRLERIAADDAADAVEVPRANYLVGRRMTHTGWGPHQDHQLRFFRRAKVQLPERVHGATRPAPGARLVRLPAIRNETIVHFNYLDLEQFLEKLNRYTSIEAREARARGERHGLSGAFAGAFRRFLGKYVKQSGWRDGWHGVVLSVYQAFYEFARRSKCIEAQTVGSREDIEARYRDIAEGILAEYAGDADSGRDTSRMDSASPSSSHRT